MNAMDPMVEANKVYEALRDIDHATTVVSIVIYAGTIADFLLGWGTKPLLFLAIVLLVASCAWWACYTLAWVLRSPKQRLRRLAFCGIMNLSAGSTLLALWASTGGIHIR